MKYDFQIKEEHQDEINEDLLKKPLKLIPYSQPLDFLSKPENTMFTNLFYVIELKANIVNSHNTANQTITTKYRLKMWIDSQVNASSWNASTKLQYKLKIKVDGQAAV